MPACDSSIASLSSIETRAGRAEQIALPQPALAHLGRVVAISEHGPGEVEMAGVNRDDLPHRQRIRLLLHDQVGP